MPGRRRLARSKMFDCVASRGGKEKGGGELGWVLGACSKGRAKDGGRGWEGRQRERKRKNEKKNEKKNERKNERKKERKVCYSRPHVRPVGPLAEACPVPGSCAPLGGREGEAREGGREEVKGSREGRRREREQGRESKKERERERGRAHRARQA
jgi:ATP-dependent RNA helicase DeaD